MEQDEIDKFGKMIHDAAKTSDKEVLALRELLECAHDPCAYDHFCSNHRLLADLERELAEMRAALATALGKHLRDLNLASSARADTARLDWMERYLCRAGEVKNNEGQTIKLARVWSIMGELETLRETVDAAMNQPSYVKVSDGA